ncbi:hypothetical protein [Myxococcus qinghaiensis]|uniref:hypothetical protein n=1 Tax=Myxococcus qinghaiensis TaxID=2906758 RepID=UPI0020A7D8D3|nr:hypothetical protein [Myxococcus qinghaiensis]MCP3166424.1 hypothetical protein [Myxococcus qinghaiensis]
MRNARSWLAGVAVFALVATGCDSENPPDAQKVADVTASRSAEMVRGVSASVRTMNGLPAVDSLEEALSVFSAGFEGVPLPALPSEEAEEEDGSSLPDFSNEAETNAQAERLEKYLRERVFTAEHVESTEGDSTVFLLKGENVCTDGSQAADTDCVKFVNQSELRIRATTLDDDGLELTFLIGSKKAQPMSLRFLPKVIALVVDLGGVKSAVQQLDAEAAAALPTVMVGQVELKVTKEGAQHWIVSGSILQALRLELTDEDGTLAISSARAVPLVELEADGVAKRARFLLDLNTTEVSLPYSGVAPALRGKNWTASLSGLSFTLEATENQKDFTVGHVGLGDAQSFLSLGADKLFTLDLNSQSGRHFDLNLSRGDDGLPLVRVQPEVDLVARFFLAPLKADSEMEVPSAYEEATYRVRFTGGTGGPSLRPVRANTTTGFKGGLQVVTGELSLTAGTSSVAVSAGQCLVGRETSSGGGSLLDYLQAGSCQ